MRKTFYFRTLGVLLLIMLMAASAFAQPWKFGVMSDTQWPNSPDNKNPNVAVNVIRHINQEFIDHGVKFVVQVGDLTDKPSTIVANPAPTTNLDIRATFAQDLYNAGIGFYPLRGNHEDKPSNPGGTLPADFYGTYAREFQRIFPQTESGVNNMTPIDAMITTTIYGPQANTNGTFNVGSDFAGEPGFEGLTYSFDYDNTRFVLIDQFTAPSGTSHSNLDSTDIDWIGSRLSSRPANTHAFVFGHKHLISENHNDNLFNSTNPDNNSATTWPLTNSFMSYLQNSGVRYYMGGHDHMHNRAIVTSPDGLSKVQNIIAASDSYKFYIPPSMTTFNTQTWRSREMQIAQEIFTVGYYIVTVDGPKVTVDYYAMPNGCNGDCDQTYDVIPYDTVQFTKHETYGYSLNGEEILVLQGGSYALTDDTTNAVANGETGYIGTTASILSGTNGSTGKDYNNRVLTKTVDTGWAPADDGLASDILTLWGMTDSLATDFSDLTNPNYHYKYVVPGEQTDVYTLSMSYDPTGVTNSMLHSGSFGLATKTANGNWVSAVDKNVGGTKLFVVGPWTAGYGLGAYGVDPSTHTAWAVINHSSDFAVARIVYHTIKSSHNGGGKLTPTQSVPHNEDSTFAATPDAGHHVKSVKIDGMDQGAIPAGPYSHTFSNVTTNHTIAVMFALDPTIKSSHNAGGTLTPTQSVPYNGSATFTATPDAGYHVKSVKIDGASQRAIPAGPYSHTFSNVTTNHTIAVEFSRQTRI